MTIAMMIMWPMIVVRKDKRMTNSPLAVGTNVKFTESATFHNSARRQLSTKPGQRLKRNSTQHIKKERKRERARRETEVERGENSHGPTQCYNFHSFQHFPSHTPLPLPLPDIFLFSFFQEANTKRQQKQRAGDKRSGKETIKFCSQMKHFYVRLSIRHKLYNYHLCILDRPLIDAVHLPTRRRRRCRSKFSICDALCLNFCLVHLEWVARTRAAHVTRCWHIYI